MRNINERYVTETYADDGQLATFEVHCEPSFNFAYDVVDDIAENDPERRAMIWVNPEGEQHTFTFADMKRWSDKTAWPGSASAAATSSWSSCADTTSSGSWPWRWRSWAP